LNCQYQECNNEVIYKIFFPNGEEIYSCKDHMYMLNRGYDNKLVPYNYKRFNPLENWNETDEHNNLPEFMKSIEMSDGEIVDTGFVRAGNWYMYKYHYIMNPIRYWRYI